MNIQRKADHRSNLAVAAMATATGSIHDKAMLVAVSITQWTARKVDRKVTHETIAAHNAVIDAGTFHKQLIGKGHLERISQIANLARNYHYGTTLPWFDNGARILPAAIYQEYAAKMRALHAEFSVAVTDFVRNYSIFREERRIALNGMFNPADYPSPDRIARKFSFGFHVCPIPAAADFRVGLTADDVAAIQTDIERRVAEQLQDATRDLYRRLRDITQSLADQTARIDATITDSKGRTRRGWVRPETIEAFREVVALVPKLNLTNDPTLARLAATMESTLCPLDSDALADDAAARETVKTVTDDALSALSDFLGIDE